MSGFRFLLASLAVTACACVDAAGEFRVEDGKIVVDSPFDLEIGSPEYAKALGKGVHSHKDVRKDPKTGATTTNWYHSAEARFAQPYFGVKKCWLTFDDEGKTLSYAHVSVCSGKKGPGGKLTFNDCCRRFDEVAADMSKRLGKEVDADDEATEEDAIRKVEENIRDDAESGRKSQDHADHRQPDVLRDQKLTDLFAAETEHLERSKLAGALDVAHHAEVVEHHDPEDHGGYDEDEHH